MARAEFRCIRRLGESATCIGYISTITYSTSSHKLWQKAEKESIASISNSISVLHVNGQSISSPKNIGNSIASTLSDASSIRNYTFLNRKSGIEKQKLNFSAQSYLQSNSNFSFEEFQSCLSTVLKPSPGPDNISYLMIQNLASVSQKNLLCLYNRIRNEHYFSTLWQQAVVIPPLKAGKDPTNPSSYLPIALTSCLCKLFEKIINRRLIHFLETNNLLHRCQSGFQKGRSTLDNLLALETDIRLAFLQRKHPVAVFFDIEKGYDYTCIYGILKDLHDFNLSGNLPIFIQKVF
ncbi:hypothetical protein AVEN_102122-1 [Araneus ventricosus]|uniref:Reverse transcriptase domain-containing protein n=1 Tax=Araneus ventricosus TaxID=182803 RepID=A0A4Y2V0N7_ARAVE|nr:hypothetical protein AVEN_102122-1 [Araneus ventricosus]